MKTKTSHRFTIPIISTLSFAVMMTAAFSQATPPSLSAPVSNPATQSLPADPPSLPTNAPVTPPASATGMMASPAAPSHFSDLTPAEHDTVIKAHQKALQDPAVQSTRQIARMTLHKAMLRIDPTIETIIATMDAHGPKDGAAVNTEEKALGGHFDKWANNIPPTSRVVLTPEDKMKLRAAHDQAMKDPAVMEARKTARATLYNAMINADPTIEPLLAKAGIKPPINVESSIKNSNIGSEEKILGGNASKRDKEVLAPTVKQQEQTAAAAETNHSP
ncbi:MAG: hypothetical protein ACH346_01320 [Chthoniobacterales bacterium]